VLVLVALALGFRWPYGTRVGVVEAQPIPFSHKHHVNDDGIDCRYYHTSVEESDFAVVSSAWRRPRPFLSFMAASLALAGKAAGREDRALRVQPEQRPATRLFAAGHARADSARVRKRRTAYAALDERRSGSSSSRGCSTSLP
jgi:hypothetical protein